MSENLHPRTKIRHYIKSLLLEKIDVGGRVFACRPTSPLFLDELPAVCIYYGEETTETWSGSEFIVKEYQRHLPITVTIAVEDIVNPEDDIDTSDKGEDFLDYLGSQVERELFYDYRLARRLPDFDPNTNFVGLTHGSRLEGVTPYDVETEDDRRVIAQDIRMIYPYLCPGYLDLRLETFAEYNAAIIRVGSTEETTDRVLLAAEGVLNEEG